MAEDKDDTFEPGAAPFGNFINYYDFNPPGNRLKLLQGQFCEFFNDSHFPEELCLLDVGSNSGVSPLMSIYFLVLSLPWQQSTVICLKPLST